MIVTVKAHEIFIAKDELVNEKEVNISNCKFKFDDEITDNFVKIAIFTKGSKSYSQVIINNECNYPAEILESTGDCILGVVMTLSSDDRIIKRYSPIPKRFWISTGSLRTAINSKEVTASEFEQYMQALQEQLGKINDLQLDVVEKGDYAKEQGDYAKEQANNIIKANVEASKIIDKFEDNVNEYTTAFDNNASEKLKSYNDNSVAKTNKFDDNYDNKVSQFNDNAVNRINDYNSNAEQKIAEYDKHSEELNNKIEDVKKAIPEKVSELENDSNYVKNTDYATNTTAGVIKGTGAFSFTIDSEGQPKLNILDYNTYKQYSLNNFISKGTLENVITGKKLETADNKVTSISSNSTDEQYPSAKCTYKIKKGLETLKNEVLETGTASDTFIHVEDSAMAEMQELSVDGVCEQETTTGKNLLPNNATSQTINGINYTVNSDKSIYAKGTATARSEFSICNKPFTLNANTEYKFQSDILMILQTSTGYISGAKGQTFTSESEISVLKAYIRVENGTSIDKTIYPMITLSNQNDTYEPYTGGQPSPSPEFPQGIKKITDSLNVTSCNDNIFNSFALENAIPRFIPRIESDGTIIIENVSTSNGYCDTKTTLKQLCPSLKVGDTIYFYCITDFTENNILKPNIYLSKSKYAISNTYNTRVITQDDLDSNVAIYGGYNTTSHVKINISYRNVKSYQTHQKSSVTFDIPDDEFVGYIDETYKDTLNVVYKDDGKYHLILNKRIRHFKLSINDMNLTEDFPGWGGQFVLSLTDDFPYSNMQLSEKTNYISNITNEYYGYGVNTNSPDYPQLWINSNVIFGVKMTQTEIKEKYPNVIVDLYYGIPKGNQYKVDLGVVDMPLSYNEVTNIFTDSDLLPIINATYYRNFTKTIQNLQVNETTLKQELININNRLSALESAKASVIDDSPSTEERGVAE